MDKGADGILAAFAYLGTGLFILYVSLITLTYSHWIFDYLRLLLAPCAIISFWKSGYGSYEPSPVFTCTLATCAIYGIMRVLEHSIVSIWDATPPHWVTRKKSADGSPVPVPLPSSFWGRCLFALDLLTSVRGLSWVSDVEWNWRPRNLPQSLLNSRRVFVLTNLRLFVIEWIMYDLCVILLRTHPWDSTSSHPLTELPLPQQVIFSVSICIGTWLPMALAHRMVACLCVLCGSNPSVWLPLFDSPFSSTSLRDFWTNRWHSIFRRVFEQLALPWMLLLVHVFRRDLRPNGWIFRTLRTLTIFAVSTLMHLIIVYRMAASHKKRIGLQVEPQFFDLSVTVFFMVQPLGVAVESALMRLFNGTLNQCYAQHLQNQETTGRTRDDSKTNAQYVHKARQLVCQDGTTLMRLFTWVFLIWTGRWWCNRWIQLGFLGEDVKLVPISPIRGLWQGQWLA